MHWMDVFFVAAVVLLLIGCFGSWRSGPTLWPYWYPTSGLAILSFVLAVWFMAHGGGPLLFGKG